MPEWLIGKLSKSFVWFIHTGGSNPSLSASQEQKILINSNECMNKNSESKKKLKWLSGISIVICLLGVLLFYFVKTSLTNGSYRSEEEMSDLFLKNEKKYVDLNEELLVWCKNGLSRIDNTWTSPENISGINMKTEELRDIRKRLFDLGAVRGMRCNNINENMYVEYLTYTSGLATGGKIQGIIYTEDIPKDYHGESEFVEYKEIKHPWFSFFESDY